MCMGTDCADACAQGQCYAEEMQRQEAQWQADEQARYEAEMERRYQEDPPQ